MTNPVLPPTTKLAPAAAAVEPAAAAATVEDKSVATATATATTASKPDAFGERIAAEIQSKGSGEPATKEAKVDPTPATATATTGDDDAAVNAEIAAATKGMDPKAATGFKDLRFQLRDLTRKSASRIAELEKEAADAKAATPAAPSEDVTKLKAELEKATARLSEQENELTVGRLEATTAFRETVTAPKKAIVESVTKLAAKYQLDPAKLIDALSNTTDEDALADAIAEAEKPLTSTSQFQLFEAAGKLRAIGEKEAVLRANAAETLAKIGERATNESEAQRATRAANYVNAAKTGWEELTKAIPLLSKAEGDDEVTKNWNAGIDRAASYATGTDFNALDAASQATIMHRAGSFDLMAGIVAGLQGQIDLITAERDKLRGAQPGAAARRGNGETARPRTGDFGADLAARIQAAA